MLSEFDCQIALDALLLRMTREEGTKEGKVEICEWGMLARVYCDACYTSATAFCG